MINQFKFFVCTIFFVSIIFTQDDQPFPPLELITAPTSGTLPKGSFTLEALLMKVPIVSTLIGVEGMDCYDKEHLLIAETDIEFANAISLLLNNHSFVENIVERGYEFAKNNYDPKKIAHQFVDTYEDIIGK